MRTFALVMKKRILLIFCILHTALSISAQESQAAYDFLRLPVSAHAAALGGDNVTLIEDDAALTFHNPALLSSVTDKTIGLGFMTYMEGARMASASFSRAVGDKASWGVGAQYADYGKMKEMDENNRQTGEFSAKDIFVAGTFSYQLTERIVGGITAKMINSYIGSYSSLAMGVDLGVNYFDPNREWSVSVVARNLGGQLKAFDDHYDRMPIDVQAGVSKRVTKAPFRLSATLVDMTHWDYRFIDHLVCGVDVLLSQTIWIGAGYNFRRAREMTLLKGTDEESSHGAGFSMGAGLQLERFKLNLAYGKYHISSHSLIINLAFQL